MATTDASEQPTAADELTNILIVDDEPAQLLLLENVLNDPGYRIVRALSADQALLALMAQEFAVMVLGIQLPDMNGIELAQLIRERKRNAHLPIIFLTTHFDQDPYRLQSHGPGAVDCLLKPVNPAVLRSKVAVFAELDRKTREIQRANLALQAEVQQRRRAEALLLELNETLERRVTERTEAMLNADRRLLAMMSSITDGLLLVEGDDRIGYVNEQGARLLGRSAGELLGLHRTEVFGDGEFETGLDNAKRGGGAVSFEALVHAGGERWLQCHCYPSPEGLSVYFHDITDRRELQLRRELLLAAEQAARSAAEHAARNKEEFLAAISHELRTPLAAIIGWVNVLTHPGVQPGMVERGVQAIARNAQAQAVLVDDLVEMNRIVSGKQLVNLERVDLHAIAAGAADTARPTAQARRLGIALQPASEPAEVMGDAGRLRQVVMNLLSNAMKFTPPGGTVTLATAVRDGWVELDVSDNGQGIAADFLPRLFDRFSPAEGTASRMHGGLGLGLPIVKNLVELHGGQVSARSAGPGQGATFSMRLPRADPSSPRFGAGGAPELGGEPSIEGVRVLRTLFIEDNAELREQIAWLLEEEGLQLESCATAEEALALYAPGKFDLVVTDVSLPAMSGVDLARVILSREPQAWVVFSSGYALGDLSSFGPHVRALLKPFEADDLQKLTAEIRAQLARAP